MRIIVASNKFKLTSGAQPAARTRQWCLFLTPVAQVWCQSRLPWRVGDRFKPRIVRLRRVNWRSMLMLRPLDYANASSAPRAVWKIGVDGLSMHAAVATSLVIIALKSFSGFYKYLDVLAAEGLELDIDIMILVTVVGITGSYVGSLFAGRIPQDKLKKVFGYFLIVMGVFILARAVPSL